MTTLLRSEFIKLRTTRTFVALTAVAGGLSLLLTVLTGVCPTHSWRTWSPTSSPMT
jgi:hypothetical protein